MGGSDSGPGSVLTGWTRFWCSWTTFGVHARRFGRYAARQTPTFTHANSGLTAHMCFTSRQCGQIQHAKSIAVHCQACASPRRIQKQKDALGHVKEESNSRADHTASTFSIVYIAHTRGSNETRNKDRYLMWPDCTIGTKRFCPTDLNRWMRF